MRCVHDSMKHVLCCVRFLIIAEDHKFKNYFGQTVFGPEKLSIEVEPRVPHIKKGQKPIVWPVKHLVLKMNQMLTGPGKK